MPRYFRYNCSEDLGHELAAWGTSTWFVEADDDLLPVRQLVVFENGSVLKYGEDHMRDELGAPGDQEVLLDEPGIEAITEAEFRAQWNTCSQLTGVNSKQSRSRCCRVSST